MGSGVITKGLAVANQWRERRERRRRRRRPVVTAAVVKPVADHAFDSVGDPQSAYFAESPVVVTDLSIDGVGMRSRMPLDLCSRYDIRCLDERVHLSSTRMRIVSCRRSADGSYDIGAELCPAA